MKIPRTSSHENGEKGSLERKMLGFRVLGNQDLEPYLKFFENTDMEPKIYL